jgi:hypothetical protein
LKDNKGRLLYSGEWKNNLYDGFGTLHNFNIVGQQQVDWNDMRHVGNYWKTYTGSFRKGKMDGAGQLVMINGDKFDGCFKEGIVHGQGAYHGHDGVNVKGKWLNGLLGQLLG